MRSVLALVAITFGCGRVDFVSQTDADVPLQPGSCPTFAVFCDNFETGDLSKWPATYINGNTTLDVETGIAHSGTHALEGLVPPAAVSGHGAAARRPIGPYTTGTVAVRLWFYGPQPLANYDIILFITDTALQHTVEVDGNSAMDWDVGEDAGSTDHATSVPVQQDVWTCVELDYTFGAPSMIDLYIDDVTVLNTPATDSMPVLEQLYACVERADKAGAHAYIDDVVLATQHIGCD